MWERVRRSLRRLAALVVAGALSGAPQVIAALEGPAPHRCQCRAGHGVHACDCPICAAQAARASSVADDDGHRPDDRAPAARHGDGDAPPPASSSAPCLRGACGTPDETPPPPSVDPFTLPPAPRPKFHVVASDLAAPRASLATAAADPELPPPRRA